MIHRVFDALLMVSGDLHSGGAIDDGANAGVPEMSVPFAALAGNNTSGPPGVWSEGLFSGIGGGYGVFTVSTNPNSLLMEAKGEDGSLRTSLLVSFDDNLPPDAVIVANPTTGPAPLTVDFDGTTSSDPEGPIAQYDWDFGDGDSATGPIVDHTYTQQGGFTATLTVTDDEGLTDQTFVTVDVTAPANVAPTAVIDADPDSGAAPLLVTFDGSNSLDPDGMIENFDWDFGDGNIGAGSIVAHTYPDQGDFEAALTVTDDGGATDTTTTMIHVNAPGNVVPTPVISADPTSGMAPLVVNFDGSASTDPDGTIAQYDWDFGDGEFDSDSGALVDHTYTTAGTYTATLTVIDNDGGISNPVSLTIEVTAGGLAVTSVAPNELAQDTTTNATLSGSGFQGGATARLVQRLGARILSTTFVDANTLILEVSVTATARLGSRRVEVTNPDGETAELANAFEVVEDGAGALALTSVTPDELARDTTTSMTLSGSGFQDGATARLVQRHGASILSTTFADANTLTLEVSVTATARLGSRRIEVTNLDGETAELANAFEVVE